MLDNSALQLEKGESLHAVVGADGVDDVRLSGSHARDVGSSCGFFQHGHRQPAQLTSTHRQAE